MVEGIGHKSLIGGHGIIPGLEGGVTTNSARETTGTQRTEPHGNLETEKVQKAQKATETDIPQLPPPDIKTSTTGVADSIVSTIGNPSINDSSKGLFVLYQLLVLLQKAMNEMQQSTQLMRQAQTNVAIANIQAQADEMESSARFALVFGIVSAAIQIGSSAISMGMGIKSAASTAKGMKINNDLKTANSDLKAMQAKKGEPDVEAMNAKRQQIKDLVAAKREFAADKPGFDSRMARAKSVADFVGSFSSFFKAIGDGMSGVMQADARRMEAQTKMMEEDANKTADLTKSVKDLLTAVLQLMQAVNRNEVDTNAQIFRGI